MSRVLIWKRDASEVEETGFVVYSAGDPAIAEYYISDDGGAPFSFVRSTPDGSAIEFSEYSSLAVAKCVAARDFNRLRRARA